jgi:Zn finger protein HypA/HybF involved in hydrogenase expression
MAFNKASTAARATIEDQKGQILCLCCKDQVKAGKQKKLYCSDHCRRLFNAALEILSEWKAGRADGLKPIIEELRKA